MFYLIFGEFNAESPTWWYDNKISKEGIRLDAFSSHHGLHQVVQKTTHLMETSASCIDLIFTNQQNLVIDSGVHPSLHFNYHHQIAYCKLNLTIKISPAYESLVLDYKKANTKKVKNLLNKFTGKIYLITKMPIKR